MEGPFQHRLKCFVAMADFIIINYTINYNDNPVSLLQEENSRAAQEDRQGGNYDRDTSTRKVVNKSNKMCNSKSWLCILQNTFFDSFGNDPLSLIALTAYPLLSLTAEIQSFYKARQFCKQIVGHTVFLIFKKGLFVHETPGS